MKALTASILTIIFFTFSSLATANTTQYEIYYPGHGSTAPFPSLDLNDLEVIKVQASSSHYEPVQSIDQLELVFKNATNLVAKNFKKDDNGYNPSGTHTYKAVVSDMWVYSKVIVKVMTNGPIAGGKDLYVELEVAEMTFELNDPQYSNGLSIFQANGILNDVTPVVISDIENLTYQNDQLSLSLQQKPKFDEFTGEGFKITANWMGHGERTLSIPTPFSSEEYSFYKAAGLEVRSETLPDGFVIHEFRIKYEDMPGGYMQYTNFEPLDMYMDQAYQSNP